jgi:hypothetical protein
MYPFVWGRPQHRTTLVMPSFLCWSGANTPPAFMGAPACNRSQTCTWKTSLDAFQDAPMSLWGMSVSSYVFAWAPLYASGTQICFSHIDTPHANGLAADPSVVWTSLGPLPRWVPGSTTRWAPGTTRLVPHDT